MIFWPLLNATNTKDKEEAIIRGNSKTTRQFSIIIKISAPSKNLRGNTHKNTVELRASSFLSRLKIQNICMSNVYHRVVAIVVYCVKIEKELEKRLQIE